MSLPRTDTGETAKPLEELSQRAQESVEKSDALLLKEALATSNDRCNNLIREQNTLIEDLIFQVEKVKENNERHKVELESSVKKAEWEIRQIAQEERQFKEKISREIAEAIRGAANEVTAYAKTQMDKSTEEVKRQLAESAKEIEKQRKQTVLQGWFRKFLFWATPVLLFVQTIMIIVSAF